MTQLLWAANPNTVTDHPLAVKRACPYGCDQEEGYKGVGYIIGDGFTIWIASEEVFIRLERQFEALQGQGR